MAEMLPYAEIVHAMPGRARLRIAARRGDAAFFASIATALSAMRGVVHVETRPLTASILIRHGAPLASIGERAEQARLFVLAKSLAPSPLPSPAMPVDPRIAVAASLGAFALWQVVQGRLLPPAVTLAWYAANLTGLLSNGGAAEGGE